MILSQLTDNSRTNNLIIQQNVFIHLIVDGSLSLHQIIHHLGINLNNCYSIYVKPTLTKIASVSINGNKLYQKLKYEMSEDKSGKNILVTKILPKKLPTNKFIIIESSYITVPVEYYQQIQAPIKCLTTMLNMITDNIEKFKISYPNVENLVVFVIDKHNTDKHSLSSLIAKFPTLTNLPNFTDNRVLVSIPDKKSPVIYNLGKYNEKGKLIISRNIVSTVIKHSPNIKIDDDDVVEEKPKTPDHELLSKVDIKQIKNDNKLEIPKITLPIKNKKLIKDIPENKDSIGGNKEKEIVKELHHTIYGGNENIRNSDKYNPNNLIAKANKIEVHSKEIVPPEIKNNDIVKPHDVIKVDNVTTPFRSEYEFSETIHDNIKKLFSILEDPTNKHPIDIKKIDYEYKDDNLNRTIDYTVSLQNKTGNNTKTYDVKLKVPAIINDKYFKLNGKYYIMANQAFMKPITKTEKNKCRLLTNFSMITFELVNSKLNISDLESVFKYIGIKYVNSLKNQTDTSIEFKNGITIDLNDDVVYSDDVERLEYSNDDNKYFIIGKNYKNELQTSVNEYVFTKLDTIVQAINPKDSLIRSKSKNVPCIEVHIQGMKFPVVFLLIQQLGLINTLTKLGLDYKIATNSDDNYTHSIPLSENLFLFMEAKNKKQELTVNGLNPLINQNLFNESNLNSTNVLDEYLSKKYGAKAIYNINTTVKNQIDPITKELLLFDNYPTNLIDLIINVILDKVIVDPVKSLADLSIYRSRQSEIIYSLMYKELKQAQAKLESSIDTEQENQKLLLSENWIINSLLGANPKITTSSVMTFTSTFNPIMELKDAAKVTKGGPGGVPNKISYKSQQRNIDDSQIGNIAANSTTENQDVGLNVHHTISNMVDNKFGNYLFRDPSKLKGWDLLSVDEAVSPFINQMDSSRAILATTHSGQAVPIKNGDVPLVNTGVNSIIPQMTSKKFCYKAKDDGIVLEAIENNYMKVKYKNGETEILDISDRLTSTKRSSYISLKINCLQTGAKFKKNQLIYWSNSFKDNQYVHGRNLKIAIMNYLGYSHEDGYVINENASKKYEISTVEEVLAIIPNNTKILSFTNKIGTETNIGDPLIEFSYDKLVDTYLNDFELLDQSEEESDDSDLYANVNNSIVVKSPGGKIKDIKIFVNNQKEVDPKLLSYWKSRKAELNKTVKTLTQYSKSDKDIASKLDNLDLSQLTSGKHKFKNNVFDGCLLKFYIEKPKTLIVGDKLSNRFGAKGIITKIINDEVKPKGEYTDEIEIFLSPSGVLGRKNFVVLKELYIGKIIYYLPKICNDKLESGTSVKEIKQLILSVYEVLDTSPNKKIYNLVKQELQSTSDSVLKIKLQKTDFNFVMIYEPFTNISFDKIESAAQLLNLPLEEHVFIPELNSWTKEKVPVGIQYIQSMEQFSKDYYSLRSTGKYVSTTGQPVKGKSRGGGQSISQLDLLVLLNYNSKNIIKELMTVRSDDLRAKRIVVSNLQNTGSTNMPEIPSSGKSQKLLKTFITSLGLTIHH